MGRFTKYRAAIKHHSKRMCKEFDQHVRETLHAEDAGSLWSYDQYVRRLNFGKQKGAQRFGLILAEVLKDLRAGLHMQAAAQCVAGIKAAHQVGIDDGSWKNAWVIAGMAPGSAPGDKLQFSGTTQEVEMMAEYVDALAKLEKASRGSRQPLDDEASEARRLAREKSKEERQKKRQAEAEARRKAALKPE